MAKIKSFIIYIDSTFIIDINISIMVIGYIDSTFIILYNFNFEIVMSKKKIRGPTQCLQIHARGIEDCQEIILDDDVATKRLSI